MVYHLRQATLITRRRRRAQTLGMEMTKGRMRSRRREMEATTKSRTMVEGLLSFRHLRDFILLLLLGLQPHFVMAAMEHPHNSSKHCGVGGRVSRCWREFDPNGFNPWYRHLTHLSQCVAVKCMIVLFPNKLWTSKMKAVPMLAESESGQIVLEKWNTKRNPSNKVQRKDSNYKLQ